MPFRFWRGSRSVAQPAALRVEPRIEPKLTRAPIKISHSAQALFHRPESSATTSYQMPRYAPGVRPASMAMDDGALNQLYGYAGQYGYHGEWAEGIGFAGYPYLAELVQRSEYRQPSEVIAEEMTRKWIKLHAAGDAKSDKIRVLTQDIKDFKLREAMQYALELDGIFGLSFIFPDIGVDLNDSEELQTKLIIDQAKIPKGSLRGFRVVDPTWTSPNNYNSTDPLNPTFFRPQEWWIMGRVVHASRLLKFTSRPVPDILKPAYNFGGLSLSQMMKPYVDNWLRTRQSVSDLLNSFTIFTLETNMQAFLAGGSGDDMARRLATLTAMRNNRGVFAIDKDMEALSNTSAPLGTLDRLQAQAQEQMAAPARLPLVKMFGITPSGLNASTDGEIRVEYDTIHGRQERVMTDPIKTCLDIMQLNRFGEIDPAIGFEYVSLWELDEAAKAAVQKTKADTRAVDIESGVIAPEEARKSVAADPESIYHGLDLSGPPPERENDAGELDESFSGGETRGEPTRLQRVGI